MIPRTEGFITVADGERVWYETAGEGPDLILTHGLGGNAAVWYQQVPYFAQHYRVISWDQRGFGRSTNENGNHGPVAAVSDLIEIMDLLDVDRAHVVGQSMGGWAALGTAIAVPDRVESVVLACTTGGIPVGFGPDSAPPLTAAPVTARPLGEHPRTDGRAVEAIEACVVGLPTGLLIHPAARADGWRVPDAAARARLNAAVRAVLSLDPPLPQSRNRKGPS